MRSITPLIALAMIGAGSLPPGVQTYYPKTPKQPVKPVAKPTVPVPTRQSRRREARLEAKKRAKGGGDA